MATSSFPTGQKAERSGHLGRRVCHGGPKGQTCMWNKNEKGMALLNISVASPDSRVPVSESTWVELCPLQRLRGVVLAVAGPWHWNPSQEGVVGRKKDADLLKKKPRTELGNPTQALESWRRVWRAGPRLYRTKAVTGGLTGTHLTWWLRTAAGARWQGTRSSWLRGSRGRPRGAGPGASLPPGAPAGRPRPASSSRAAGGCRDLHGWEDRERAAEGPAAPALRSPPATALFPAESRYVQLTVSTEQPLWTACDIFPHHYKPACPSNNTGWGKVAFRTAYAVKLWWKMYVWK